MRPLRLLRIRNTLFIYVAPSVLLLAPVWPVDLRVAVPLSWLAYPDMGRRMGNVS